MKKLLVCLTVLFSTFLFTNKVSAAEPITTVGTSIYNLEDCTYFTYTEEQIENLIQNAKLKLTELGYNADEFNKFNLTVSRASYGIVPYFYLFNDLDIENNNYRFTLSNSAYAPITIGYSTTNGRIRYYKKNATNAGQLVYNYFYEPETNTNAGFKYFEANDSSGVYILTNFDLKNSSGEVIIPQNYNTEPVPNEFKETINSTQYSKVEFIFDVPNMETNFNFNYDFHLVDSNGNLDTLNTFKSPYFEETYTSCLVDESGVASCKPLPVVDNFVIKNASEDDGQCHLDEFGLNNCYKPNDYSNNEELNISNSYVVKNYDMAINNNILTKMTSKLKLIIDLEFNPSVYIDASFTSSLPFEVKYYERTTTTDYYSTVDLTGKYGALFMPKFDNLEDTLNIRTLFKGDGHLDIQHRSSIDLIDYKILSAYSMNYCNEYLYNQDNIPYSCSEYSGEFEFYVSNNNLEQGLFFVNSHFDNDNSATATITYDTRYYVYWVFDTPSSIVPVENPNTGEKEYISLDGFYNYADVDPGFLENLFNTFTDQLYDTFPVIQQFLMVINLFDYNEEYDEAPKLMVSLDSIGIDQEVQIVDFGVFHEHRSTLIFWEMLFITTITVIKVTDNVVKAMKD